MRPKVELVNVAVGRPNDTVLVMLVASIRSSKFFRSVTLMCFNSDMSMSKKGGPQKYPLPVLPSWPGAGAENFETWSGVKRYGTPLYSVRCPRSCEQPLQFMNDCTTLLNV